MDIDGEVEAGAQNIVSDQACRARLGDGAFNAPNSFDIFAANENDAVVRLHGVGAENHALQKLVRITFEQQPILERSGLHLVTIDDDIPRAGTLGE